MNRRPLLLVLIAVAALCPPAFAADPSSAEDAKRPATYGRSSVFSFIDALGLGLSWANGGAERQEKESNRAVPETPEGLTTWFADTMTAAKLSANDYTRAITAVHPFADDPDELVNQSAKGFELALTAVIQADRRLLGMLEAMADGDAGREGDRLRELSDARAQKNEAWKTLPLTVIPLATHALVHLPDRDDEKLSKLRVTKKERQRLLESLRDHFGPGVGTPKDNPSSVRAAASILYQFLARKEWKALDE